MTLSQDVADLAVAMKAVSDGAMDATIGTVGAAWAAAWGELSTVWAAALDDLIAAADGGQWPSRATVMRSERALAALRQTVDRVRQLRADGDAAVTGELARLLRLAEDHQIGLIAAQFPEDYAGWSAVRINPRALDAVAARATQTIGALSWPIPADVEAVIKSALIKGVVVGDNPRKAAADMLARIGARFDGGRARAENIARTEMIDAYRAGATQSRAENSAVLSGWMWTAYLGPRTCMSCVAMHGTVFRLDEPGPLDHHSGRCVATPVTRAWRDLGIDMDEPPRSPVQDGPAWLARQPAKVQRQVMGPKCYDAWRAGRFPPGQWAVTRRNAGWRDSIVPGVPGGKPSS